MPAPLLLGSEQRSYHRALSHWQTRAMPAFTTSHIVPCECPSSAGDRQRATRLCVGVLWGPTF